MSELMSVYNPEGSDRLVGLLFQSKFGAFARENRRWVALTPQDARFDGLEVTDVLPEHNEEALAAFDSGEAKLSDLAKIVSPQPIDPAAYAHEEDNQ